MKSSVPLPLLMIVSFIGGLIGAFLENWHRLGLHETLRQLSGIWQ
jgi:hypothetical protein